MVISAPRWAGADRDGVRSSPRPPRRCIQVAMSRSMGFPLPGSGMGGRNQRSATAMKTRKRKKLNAWGEK